MAIISELISGGIEGIAKGIGGLARDLRAAITGKEALSSADISKLAEIANRAEEMVLEAENIRISAVNATMQAEAKSEHWAQWLWRPMFGFTGSAMMLNNFILLPYLKNYGIVPLVVPSEVWLMLMAVLGVAAYTRGTEKTERAKNGK